MTRQLDYYHRHKAEINAKKRAERKANVKPVKPSSLTSELHIPKSELTLRCHRVQRTRAILNAISKEKMQSLHINDKLNSVTQYIGTGFRIIEGTANKVLEIEGLELISDSKLSVAIVRAQAITLADNLADSLALQYGLILSKEGHTPEHLTEIELNATQVTEKLKQIEKKGILELWRDENGYAIWADWSFGVGGIESNNVLYLERLRTMARDIAEQDAWNTLKVSIPQLAKTVLEIRDELKIHQSAYRALEKVAKKLDKRLSQTRLEEFR